MGQRGEVLLLKKVLYAPSIDTNIVSVRVFVKCNYKVQTCWDTKTMIEAVLLVFGLKWIKEKGHEKF